MGQKSKLTVTKDALTMSRKEDAPTMFRKECARGITQGSLISYIWKADVCNLV